jgi:hypothetical protein
VVLLIAAAAILVAVVVVASGRGGEMASPRPDYAPPDLGSVTAADVALLRPPSAVWGYNMRVTDEALERIAQAMQERDIQIAALQRQVADLRESRGAGPVPQNPGAGGSAGQSAPLPRRTVPGRAAPGRDTGGTGSGRDTGGTGSGRGEAAQEQLPRRDQTGQAQAGQNQGGYAQPAWGCTAGGHVGPLLQGHVIPRHAAVRPPSGHGKAQDSTWYGPAPPGSPGPPGSREHGDWRQEEPGE